ncbi:hypothetical protein [Nakamurella flava]|uniref:hypothetical protein n=1 Tax=Nakamurella flava TaxID=2576308 RepID=UPI0014079857|nr:hypothetical protein [Nakamurella flava]
MSDHDDRLARLEAKVDELARRVDQLGSGGAAAGTVSDFDAENDTNRFPPKSEF